MRMKRTCERCRACICSFGTLEFYCTLGYKQRIIEKDIDTHASYSCVPAEPCHKPITNKQYIDCRKQKKKELKNLNVR